MLIMTNQIVNRLKERRWFVHQATELSPALSRATIQDWISDINKRYLKPRLVAREGRPDVYVFSAEELIHLLVLTWLSRLGLLRVRSQHLVNITLNPAIEEDDEGSPPAGSAKLNEPAKMIRFCRNHNFDVGVIIHATVEKYEFQPESFPFTSIDRRIRKGDVKYWVEFRPYAALQRIIGSWLGGEDHEAEFPGEWGQMIGLLSVAELRNHVVRKLHLDRED